MVDELENRRGEEAAWRRSSPKARAVVAALYSWQAPALVFAAGLSTAMVFALAAFLSPALLSLAPTLAVIAPVAEARAAAAGAASYANAASPLHLLLLSIGDLFFDQPGRIHLAAKGLGALLAAGPLAYFAAVRFPGAQAVLLAVALAAYVTAPFAGSVEISLALFVSLAVALLSAPADESPSRARTEGALCGALLLALWTSHPVFALLGFLALSACPFIAGKTGFSRYAAAMIAALVLAALAELAAPGLTLARANAASGAFASDAPAIAGAAGFAGVLVSTMIVILAAAIFGGREHWRAWAPAAIFLALSFVAARIAGAQAAPLFALAGAFAVFSTASPFYDGIFRSHDRASVAVAGTVGALTIFWTCAIVAQSAGQFALQFRTAATSEASVRNALGLVQPGGPQIAKWIEEGRFSTPEARDLFALAPVDQSAILLEAAERAKSLTREGLAVAFLTGADAACVIAEGRACAEDGLAAAKESKVVFVPRLDFDAATAAAKDRSQALLYTEFKMVERTPLWDIWVRRGVNLPAEFLLPS